MANTPENLKPTQFKTGFDPRRHVKQKGETSFKKDFEMAVKEVARALRLGEKPNELNIRLIITGLREALKGNYPFWNKFMETIYKEMRQKQEIDVTSGGKPIPILEYVRSNDRSQENLEAEKKD